jgi:hypothetical protein
MLRAVIALVVAGLSNAPSTAQEKYAIKIRQGANGDVIKVSFSLTSSAKLKVTAEGKENPLETNEKVTSAYTDKIIDDATRFERTFSELSLTGKQIAPALIGMPILTERSGKEYKFSADGKELSGDANALQKEFNEKASASGAIVEELMLPKEAIGVDKVWKPDLAVFVKAFPYQFDMVKANASGKLLKVYKQSSSQFGAFEIEMNIPLTAIPSASDKKTILDNGSRIKMVYHFDGCIDGTSSTRKTEFRVDTRLIGTIKTQIGDARMDGVTEMVSKMAQEQIKQQ